MKAEDIKSMKLYQNFERLDNEINLLMSTNERLDASQLYPFDTMHYFGVSSVEEAVKPYVEQLREKEGGEIKVLDVGSGLGGPARFMAEKMKCKVLAVEYQKQANDYAEKVTGQVHSEQDLKALVIHQEGDINALIENNELKMGNFTVISSFLTFLHIDDKDNLFKNMRSVIQEGGFMIVEDYYRKRDDKKFTEREETLLGNEVFCNPSTLPTEEEYIAALERNGFKMVYFKNMTNEWSLFVKERYEAYVASKERQVSVHGEETFKSQCHFYNAVNELFKNGEGEKTTLGGVRLVCQAVSVE